MEDREKEYLLLNLDKVVHMTCCSKGFLQNLVAANILTKTDVDEIVQCRREKGSYAETSLLYHKCMAKNQGYQALTSALRESKQTEPFELLMDFYRTHGSLEAARKAKEEENS